MRTAWSRRTAAAPAALHLAREAGLIVLRDADHGVSSWGPTGEPLAHRPPAGPLVASSSAEDGRTVVLGGPRGEIIVLRDELSPGWERSVGRRPTALAVAPLGQAIAVADESGSLTVFDADGRQAWQAKAARPLLHLAWVAESGALVGAADFGLVGLYDASGGGVWRDGLVAHVGGLAVSGDGRRIVLACFTEGLKRYSAEQQRPVSVGKGIAARAIAMNYAGDVLLTIGLEGTTLTRRDAEGQTVEEIALPGPVAGLAADALGEAAVVALTAGELRRYELGPEGK